MKKIYQRVVAIALAGTTLLGVGLWHQYHRIGPGSSKQVTKKADALPTGVSDATLANIRSSLEKQEYHISFDEQKKKLQSPNRRNNIRAYYEPGKLTVQTRVDTTGEGFKMELVNEGVFADGKLLYTPEIAAKAEHHENKVQISHSAFTEEFINNEDGVRQNFIVKNAPEGTRQLQVKINAKGLKVEQGSGNELRFYSKAADGQTRNELVYSDLKCWDTNKKPLNATLAYVDNRIQISVDVAGAAYPVTIDPIIANGTPQNANKVLQVDQSYMWLGFSVASAGDVNGDGYSDVVVGAPQYDLGEDNEGGAFVYKGDPSGLTLTAVTFQSNQIGAKMGYSVASAGDFNGDGFSDVLVGIPYYDKDAVDEGRANLYLGSSTFFSSSITAYSYANGHAGALTGITVATAGDIDGDGYSDVLIGAIQDSNGQSKEGTVALSNGSANGNLYSKGAILEINQANAQFGYSIAPAGDIDADGYSDVIVGARWYTNGQGQEGEGAAFIYRGGSTGLQGNPTIIEGSQYNAALGNRVSSAGDVNGDGYSDVLISAYLYDLNVANEKDHGIVNLYLGSSTGISSQQPPSRTFFGKGNDHMGSSVACAGDVNGDGYSDILLGAEYYDNGQFNEGGVFVYYGSQGNVGIVGEPVATMESNQGDGWFGTAVASAGDVNGDGYSDILIGCYTFDNGQKDEGHVFVYHGGAEGIGTKDAVTITNNEPGAQMGLSVASAGDVNGDGYDDVIVGAPYYDSGESAEGVAFVYSGSIDGVVTNTYKFLQKNQANAYFGGSVAGAGDVNGDGYDDILIGAKEYSNGQSNEGAAFLYPGSASGIDQNAAPFVCQADKADADYGFSVAGAGDINRDGYADIIIGAPTLSTSGVAFVYFGGTNGPGNPTSLTGFSNTHFGEAVASAGDVNGDGYSDVLVGAPKYDNGQADEGAAFLYPGTAGGISLAATVLECNQANAQMGYSVSNAGDINNDGFSDIMVGAPYYDASKSNEGVVMFYKGSANGLVTNSPYVFKLDQAEANLGISVAMAGDVNGDGYSDMLAGAHQFDNGQSNEGVGVLIPGAPNGLGLVTFLECNQANAMMGFAVAGAGDVDGDGFSDVMAGARFYSNGQALEGAAFVFKGSANGLITANPTVIESNQVDARLGHALSPAGDVNGDGFSDIAIGAYQYDKGNSNEGVVMIHYGSANGMNTVPSLTLESDQTEAQFGISVACAGDVNADGYADLIVGSRYYDKGQVNEGAVFIYQGSQGGLSPMPVSVLESNQGDAWLGSAVAPAGDVNGDGFSDVLVGSYAFDHGQKDEGSVFVWYGEGKGPDEKKLPSIISQLKPDSYEGNQVAYAGDVNGDGFSDVIVGAIRYEEYQVTGLGAAIIYYGSPDGISSANFDIITQTQLWPYPQFGCSVSSAGDVNSDGFDDVIIGAYAYQTGGGDAGAVFIYYGSPSGINLNSFSTLFDTNIGSEFGRSVSKAGDINNDGYDDVIIGAPLYQANQVAYGAAYLYFGSSNGIQSPPQIIEGVFSNSQFGFSVSGAGDTNGDGFSDLIIGAKAFSDVENGEGAAFLYKGSGTGIKTNEVTILQENQANGEMGSSVSTAGDVNSDGFGDVIVGAPKYGKVLGGAAFVYYGSYSGINVLNRTTVESDKPGSLFGISVRSSGDVNADGYGDIIIGAQDYNFGAAFVFNGSPNGIIVSIPWYCTSDINTNYGELMGASAAGAGDVNADGFSDVIIGSLFYKWKGASLLFYGNAKFGLTNAARLYNTDLTTPINHTQFAQTNFGAGLFAKSFTGRNKSKLVWETKPTGQGFSKGSNNRITNSTQSTNSQNAYSNLGTTGLELKNVIDKQGPGTKVRMRVKYDPVLALTGQSYGPWRYLPAYLMGNSTAPVPEETGGNLSETIEKKAIRLEEGKASEGATIYPNPVSSRLNIDLKDRDQVQSLRILTATGSVAYQSNELQSSVNVSKLPEGAYFLIIAKTDGSHTTRQILIRR